EYTCFPGRFSLHPEYQGTYTCNFAARGYNGRLFITGQTLNPNGHCYHSTIGYYSGIHTFIMEKLVLNDRPDEYGHLRIPPIFAFNNVLWVR
ncbi:hypothetical protein PMAYCL1PPCAC_13228, partial [Pristionchus mayeri]